MLEWKEALLLDMNSTFMFGEDRFGSDEDFSKYYRSIGGELSNNYVNELIRYSYDYLDKKYPTEKYRHCFPSLEEAIVKCSSIDISESEIEKIIETFSFHEHGEISESYVTALRALKERFTLTLVIDIWAPKSMWVNTFKALGIWELISAHSFSSDHGMVKPSPKPFEMVVTRLGIPKERCLVVGDSIRRDLGGAQAAGIDCILVGDAKSELAVGSYPTLIAFQKQVQSST